MLQRRDAADDAPASVSGVGSYCGPPRWSVGIAVPTPDQENGALDLDEAALANIAARIGPEKSLFVADGGQE